MDSILPERLLALVRPAFDLVLRRIRSLKRCVQACGCKIMTPRYAVWQNAQQLPLFLQGERPQRKPWLAFLVGFWLAWLGFWLAFWLVWFGSWLAFWLVWFGSWLAWLGFWLAFWLVWFGSWLAWLGFWLAFWLVWFGSWLAFWLVWFGLQKRSCWAFCKHI